MQVPQGVLLLVLQLQPGLAQVACMGNQVPDPHRQPQLQLQLQLQAQVLQPQPLL